MSGRERYDYVVIGTGAGGGTIAHELAKSGKRILILERGGFLPRERENWETGAVFGEKRYLARETWYDREDRPFEPYTHYWVGGNTKVYGAALLRMRASDFGEVRHSGGISPAWPVTYDEMEPYYARAEAMYSVHGERGRDPCEPRASGPYPFAAVEPEPRMKELFEGFARLGLRPFPCPLGVRLNGAGRGAAPYRLGRFDGYPDLTEVKRDAHVVGIKPIADLPNVTLLTGAFVERLSTDASGGRVDGVEFRMGGERHVVRGERVVLAAGAVNSAALLLRSASDRHPDGLANSSGQVGRNYMCHQNGCVVVVTEDENPSQFQKYFCVTDYYHGAPDWAYPLGLIQLMGKPDPWTLGWLRGGRLPGVELGEIAARTIDFFVTAEDLPDPENRVTLREDGSIRLCYRANNTEAYDRLEGKLVEAMVRVENARGRARPVFLSSRLGVSGVSHQNGTLRFGTDPATSVLDVNCRAHEVENLYVADASFFPSSGAVNPSLTIMANALRVAEHLEGRRCGDADDGPRA
ncbi:MAG: FAD-dependent oxidoreductase [Phycisphaerales bacterium]